MQQKTFIINYTVTSNQGKTLKSDGVIKVKACYTSLQAMVKLEQYMKRKYSYFGKLVVHSCKEENPYLGFFNDLFN